MGQFGDRFKKEREKRGFSLDDVSNVTKIGSRMLQAIEEEHFDQLPGGVFNKGFIRAYARHLGLNDEEAVTEYLACLRQAQIDAQAAWNPQARPPAPEKRPLVTDAKPSAKSTRDQPPPPREELPNLQLPRAEHVRPPRGIYAERRGGSIPWRILVVSAVVVVLLLVLWSRRSHRISPPTTASASQTSIPLKQPQTQPASSPVAASAPPTATQEHPYIPNPQSPQISSSTGQTTPAASRAALPSHPNPATGADSGANSPENQPVNPPGISPEHETVNPLPPAQPVAPMALVIRASENSWISVTADGQPVSQETLIAPAHTSIRANREIVVRVGNAAGVTFLWNGKEIPAQGAEAEVKTVVFDSSGMRTVSTPQPPDQNR